jgi:hypothetical protein
MDGGVAMSFVLALIACLATTPTQCKHLEFRLDACGTAVPSQIVEWLAEHPDYRIARWSCTEGVSA